MFILSLLVDANFSLALLFRASLLESSLHCTKIDCFVHTDGDRKTVRLSYNTTHWCPHVQQSQQHYWKQKFADYFNLISLSSHWRFKWGDSNKKFDRFINTKFLEWFVFLFCEIGETGIMCRKVIKNKIPCASF